MNKVWKIILILIITPIIGLLFFTLAFFSAGLWSDMQFSYPILNEVRGELLFLGIIAICSWLIWKSEKIITILISNNLQKFLRFWMLILKSFHTKSYLKVNMFKQLLIKHVHCFRHVHGLNQKQYVNNVPQALNSFLQ